MLTMHLGRSICIRKLDDKGFSEGAWIYYNFGGDGSPRNVDRPEVGDRLKYDDLQGILTILGMLTEF